MQLSGSFLLATGFVLSTLSGSSVFASEEAVLREPQVKQAWSNFRRDQLLTVSLSHNSISDLQDCNSAYYLLSNLVAKEKPWMGFVYSNYASIFGQAAYAGALFKDEQSELNKPTTFKMVVLRKPLSSELENSVRGKIDECDVLYKIAVERVAENKKNWEASK